jgi:outer membrane protein TolC
MNVLALLLAVSSTATPPAPLTVREAAALAAGESPAVTRARAETDVARARESAARSRLGPSLTADVGFLSTNDPVDAFSLSLKQERFSAAGFFASDPNHPGSLRDWSGALTASWTVDLFGAVRGEARAAAGSTRAAERSAGRTRDTSAMQAVLAFASARRAEDALALLTEREADARRDAEIAVTLLEQGMTTAADPARARAALAEVRAEAAGHRAALEEARAALAALIGPEAARRPLADLPGPRAVPETATGERDDVAAAELAANAARDQEKAASRSRWPSLSIQGRYERHAPRPADRWGDSASIFGGFRIPLFTSGAIDSRVAQSRSAARSAEASAEAARRVAQKEIATARAALAASEARLAAFSEAEAAARQAREIQQARYDEGEARLADLLEARAAELRARLGASGAKSERVAAEATLRLALGLPPEGEEIP